MRKTLHKTVVKAFYRQQAGFFLFIFLIFFGVLAPSEQLSYHYALIRGLLAAPAFFLLVCLAWLLYAGRVAQFVVRTIDSPEGLFLYQLKHLSRGHCYRLLLSMQWWLFLPVWGYSLAITGVALYQHAWVTAILVQVYLLLIGLVSAGWYAYRLEHPGVRRAGIAGRRSSKRVPYWSILMRYLLQENKALLLGVKVFSCVLLIACSACWSCCRKCSCWAG